MKWIVGAAAFLGFAMAGRALTIVNYDPATNDRFYPSADVPNASGSFVASGFDLSGVGWNSAFPSQTQSFTMINSQYFVYASHDPPPPGSMISFYSPALAAANPGDPSAAILTMAVDTSFVFTPILSSTGQPSDLSIGRLVTPISASFDIAAYPILTLPSQSDYVGLPLLLYGRGATPSDSPVLGTNTLNGFALADVNNDGTADSSDFTYTGSNTTGNATLEGGDSGSPTFVEWDGQLALIGDHSGFDTDSPVNYYDNFIPDYLDQLSDQMITFTAVPEPGRGLLCGGALAWLMLRRRRGRATSQG